MADYDNRVVRDATAGVVSVDAGLRAYMLRVYNYMTGAMVLTGAMALLTVNTPLLNVFYHQVQTANGTQLQPTIAGLIATFAPFGLALYLQFRVMNLSFSTAQSMYWLYSALMGISLSFVLLLYTGASVALTFFITAAMFGGMSLYGYTTKRDLTGFGSFLIMGAWGIFIAFVVNIFLKSPMIDMIASMIGVFVFTGLAAYYNQAIKNIYDARDDAAAMGKKAILGALVLYISFVNLFLMLLRFTGAARR